MDINFYSGEKGKIMGLMGASPEELQNYIAALMEVPDGCQLTTRTRMVQVGKNVNEKRREILIGAAEVGKPLLIDGEVQGHDKPLPVAQTPKAMEIRQGITDAKDEDLEVMAARNNVKVTDGWKKRGRNLRNADVERAMRDRSSRESSGQTVPLNPVAPPVPAGR